HLGQALYSPKSEIRLRLLTRGREPVDATWWQRSIASAAARRAGLAATAYRVVHAEGDGLPSLVVDRYGPYVVAQLLSAGLEQVTYHGSFALHLARRAAAVVAVDTSAEALARGRENATLNGLTNIVWREANAFDELRELERRDERFDTVVLDPPAFAKSKQSLVRALAGYKEINLRAMRLLEPGGVLFTCSCSYHVNRSVFLEMVADAARDSGIRLELLAVTGAGRDHPEIVNVPETGYLKGALLRAAD